MTNREKYKKAFSAVYPSNEFSWEVEKMKRIKRRHIFKTMAASIAGYMIFMASATAAYAMDVGGIQRTIQLWIHGDRRCCIRCGWKRNAYIRRRNHGASDDAGSGVRGGWVCLGLLA